MLKAIEKKKAQRRNFKTFVVAAMAGIALSSGTMALANTCPGNNSGISGETCNQTSQLEVRLNWRRPASSVLTTWASARVTARTNLSRRIRVNLRWYDVWDNQREASGWFQDLHGIPQHGRLPVGATATVPFLAAQSRDGRFRTSGQRMPHGQTTWLTTSAATANQSRSWNMR